jgi:hypothetical protein
LLTLGCFSKIAKAQLFNLLFPHNYDEKIGWATFWAIFYKLIRSHCCWPRFRTPRRSIRVQLNKLFVVPSCFRCLGRVVKHFKVYCCLKTILYSFLNLE